MNANAILKVIAEMELDASPDCRFAISEAKVKRWAEQLRSAARGGGEAVACSVCKGAGSYPQLVQTHDPQDGYEADIGCPHCGGTGATPPAPAIPEGWISRLREAFPLFDDEGLSEAEHCCEWSMQQDRKRLHAILAAPPPEVVR